MTSATDLARMVPGFDFLQGLLKNAGAGLPNFGAWVAPTLNPEELEKKIQELKTVLFWLEQNAKLLATTIQAMEVQRMTLSTLQSMNVPLADLSEALKIKMPSFAAPASASAPASAPAFAPASAPTPQAEPDESEPEAAAARRSPAARKAATAQATTATPAVDPLQWWGALTQQFTELATKAVKDSALEGSKSLAGAMVKSSLDTAAGALKKAASLPGQAAVKVAAKATGKAAPHKRPAPKRSGR